MIDRLPVFFCIQTTICVSLFVVRLAALSLPRFQFVLFLHHFSSIVSIGSVRTRFRLLWIKSNASFFFLFIWNYYQFIIDIDWDRWIFCSKSILVFDVQYYSSLLFWNHRLTASISNVFETFGRFPWSLSKDATKQPTTSINSAMTWPIDKFKANTWSRTLRIYLHISASDRTPFDILLHSSPLTNTLRLWSYLVNVIHTQRHKHLLEIKKNRHKFIILQAHKREYYGNLPKSEKDR